jgi:hypothetical protein
MKHVSAATRRPLVLTRGHSQITTLTVNTPVLLAWDMLRDRSSQQQRLRRRKTSSSPSKCSNR